MESSRMRKMPEATYLLRTNPHTYNVYDNYYIDELEYERYSVLVLWGGYMRAACCTRIVPPGYWRGLTLEERIGVGMSMLERPTPPSAGDLTVVPSDGGWAKEYPCLAAYLHQTRYRDGSPRERSTITLFGGDDGGWRVVLNDREEGRSLWASGPDLRSVWVSLEAQLGAGNARWRYDVRQPAKRRGK